MPDIYRKSNQVIVWLGGKEEEISGQVDRSVSVIDMMNRDIRNETSPDETMMDKMFKLDGTWKTAAPTSDYSKLLYRTILPYFDSEWFSRRWIVQEVALVPKGVCYRANHQTNLTDVLRAEAWFIYQFGNDDDREQRNIRHAATIFRYADPEFAFYHNRKHTVTPWDQKLNRSTTQARFRYPTFSVLLMDLMDQDASEPRDKIYGLLSLTEWTSKGKRIPRSLQPNYNRTVAEVYREATREAIRSAGNLNVLECVSRHKALHNTNRLRGYGRDNLPCWCPQWDRQSSHERDATGLGANFRADGGRPLDMAPLVSGMSPSSLHLRGLPLDEVIRTSAVMRPDVLCCTPGILPQAQGHFWPIVVADENTLGASAALKNDPQDETLLAPNSDDWTWPRNHHDIFARMDKQATEKSCRNRRFFITKSGYMGIGPKTMRTGNKLMLLYGGKWPFLLFPTVNEYYYFVGPCYVNGIMQGEALGEHEKEGDVGRVFEIRQGPLIGSCWKVQSRWAGKMRCLRH